jgi:acetyltransferase-like isoleucine patch superfamily enzyme
MYKRLYYRFIIILNSVSIRLLALSRGSWISLGATIHIHSGGCLKIGQRVGIAKNAVLSVLPGAILELKDGCMIGHGVTIFCANSVIVGAQSRIAHYCSLVDHDYDIHAGESWFERPKISSPIIMGDKVWLGAHAIILKGVTIGRQCVIGAQTIVLKSVPEGMLVYRHSNGQLTQKAIVVRL